MPPLSDEALKGDWEKLNEIATQYLGEVPIGEVIFDPSRRRAIDVHVFDSPLRPAMATP